MNLRRLGRRTRDLLTRLTWVELALLGGVTFAIVLNAAAGTWVAVLLLTAFALMFVTAAYWHGEFQAECQSHDHTLHQLDEARAEVRRLSGDVVRWADFGGQR